MSLILQESDDKTFIKQICVNFLARWENAENNRAPRHLISDLYDMKIKFITGNSLSKFPLHGNCKLILGIHIDLVFIADSVFQF